ncbi:MAG: hypothetical protein JXQ96_22680 [Cyclobacteriaceae bacterium]
MRDLESGTITTIVIDQPSCSNQILLADTGNGAQSSGNMFGCLPLDLGK